MVQLELLPLPAQPEDRPRSRPRAPATNTVLAYEADLRGFAAWCAETKRSSALPVAPKLVASYLYYLWADRQKRRSTVERAMFAIAALHERSGLANPIKDPVVKNAWRAILMANERGRERKASLLTDGVRTVLESMRDGDVRDEGDGLRLVRDRAIILLLFAGALKRDELRTLTVENVAFAAGGLRVRVAAGDRAPRDVVIVAGAERLTDPAAALAAWLRVAGIASGAVIRSVDSSGKIGAGPIDRRSLTRAIQARCKRAGLDPRQIATMSLRTGFVVEAARGGASIEEIAEHTGHRERGLPHIADLVRTGRMLGDTQNHPGRKLGL